jgi:hypothetical protein
MCTLSPVCASQFSDAKIASFPLCANIKGLSGDPAGTKYKQPFVNTCGNSDYRVIQKCEDCEAYCANCDAHNYIAHRHSNAINGAITKIVNKDNNKKIITNGDECLKYTELTPNALDAHFKQNLIQIGGAKLEERYKKNSDDPLEVHHIIPKKNFDCSKPEHRAQCFHLGNIMLLRRSIHNMVHSEENYKHYNTYDKIIRMISEQTGARSSLQMEPIVKPEVTIVKPEVTIVEPEVTIVEPEVTISSVVDRTDLSTLDDNALKQWMHDETQKKEKRERLERERLEREEKERYIQRRKEDMDIQRRKEDMDIQRRKEKEDMDIQRLKEDMDIQRLKEDMDRQ